MTQFGLPRRNATEDANAGIVNPPSLKRETRQVAGKELQKSSLDIGTQRFGEALGQALEQRLTEEAHNINEQRAMDAAIRQGHKTAINQEDALKKRTGWTEAVFGQNVEYRAAQQRAASNAVRGLYIEQAAKVDEYAGETPEQYATRLKANLDKVLEPYKDDADTKRIVSATWLENAEKLATAHHNAHYGYNQLQQRETYEKEVEQYFDTLTLEAKDITDPREAIAKKTEVQQFFNGRTKPDGMTELAWKASVNKQIMAALQEGNIGAYNAAKGVGWVDKLNTAEQAAMDRAVSAYDGHFNKTIAVAYEQAEIAARDATSTEDAIAVYEQLLEDLGAGLKRSSGTSQSLSALTKGGYKDILGRRESGGDYRAKNQYGYIGKYQFGGQALQSVGYKDGNGEWTGKDGVYSEEDWFNTPKAQDRAVELLTSQNHRYLEKKGAFDKIGDKLEGVTITRHGLLAASHLVGASAVNKMLRTGVVPKDGNGTTAIEYMKLFENYEDANATDEDVYTEAVKDVVVGFDEKASGTEKSKLTLAKAINSVNQVIDKIRANAEKVQNTAIKNAAKAEAKAKRNDQIQQALREGNPVERAAKLNAIVPKPAELKENLDVTIVQDVENLLGLDESISPADTTRHLLANPHVSKILSNRLRGMEVESPLLKRTIETVINGYSGLANEDGTLSEEGKTAMASIAQFAQNEDTFMTMIGQANYDMYEIVRTGAAVGLTMDMVNKHIDEYRANKGHRDVFASDWELGEGESKRDRITSLIRNFTGDTPTPASLAYYMDTYDRALTIYQSDRDQAENYLKVVAKNAGLNYKGHAIINGKKLNKVTSFNFEQLMDGVQKVNPDGSSLLSGYLNILSPHREGKTEDPATWPNNIDDVLGLKIYTVDGIAGFYMDSTNAQTPIHITEDTMRTWDKILTERNNFEKMRIERETEANAKRRAEQQRREKEWNREAWFTPF